MLRQSFSEARPSKQNWGSEVQKFALNALNNGKLRVSPCFRTTLYREWHTFRKCTCCYGRERVTSLIFILRLHADLQPFHVQTTLQYKNTKYVCAMLCPRDHPGMEQGKLLNQFCHDTVPFRAVRSSEIGHIKNF